MPKMPKEPKCQKKGKKAKVAKSAEIARLSKLPRLTRLTKFCSIISEKRKHDPKIDLSDLSFYRLALKLTFYSSKKHSRTKNRDVSQTSLSESFAIFESTFLKPKNMTQQLMRLISISLLEPFY